MKRFALLLVLSALLWSGCDSLSGASNIEYAVTGTATKVSLTYGLSGGGTEQIASTTVPWSYPFRGKKGDFLYLSAQIVEGTGTVVVTIKKNGETFKTATSSGFASVATASGTLD